MCQFHKKYPVLFIARSAKNECKKIDIKVIHTIVSGDSLWPIARQYNTHLDKNIVRWNHILLNQATSSG
ncbi:LysM peptidoglycan-binding domain-containing protein [Candidatus Ruthia endofausta]|uniref:LysM peptidoglycan-binding domain-containing protein n=1 Tax=Candidatus Ruthia endofausta TaxID=2738852 RepID=A0A6N0HMW9_9GAMM|nr:LysM peptidoglycan-binding domain-containing protein [Candidatus Ruthia endofausta]